MNEDLRARDRRTLADEPLPSAQWMPEARIMAAQCWQDSETSDIEMDVRLAEAFAARLARWMAEAARFAGNADYWRERAQASDEPSGAEPEATKPFTYPPCESYKPGGDTCAHCGKDVGPHCGAQALRAAQQVPDDDVIAFGCDEEAHGEVRCEKWCKSAICAASLVASPPPERADARDAARYRWLRDPKNANRDEWNAFGPYSTAAEIDAAIDAAMRKLDPA